ncbi:hypothetical protein [Lysobacter sp. N42]|uniref:hypothetical protein n=1 Tax=Lysobacter sp. N42 TaxID=2545719 RepID=UPI0010457C9B|nr:hypothetical protein [Lysobacter sp. N42]TCZ78629.1 hypothetical protein EYQ95_25490 [Lysobacter sp. N42]
MYRKALTAALASIAISGCATVAAPTAQELAAADYGPPISQEDAERLAKEVLSTVLKDPYSAVYQCQAPEKGWRNDTVFEKYRKHYGYVLKCMVNAKNSYGGYVGAKPYEFVINRGQVVAAYGQQDAGSGVTYMGKIK